MAVEKEPHQKQYDIFLVLTDWRCLAEKFFDIIVIQLSKDFHKAFGIIKRILIPIENGNVEYQQMLTPLDIFCGHCKRCFRYRLVVSSDLFDSFASIITVAYSMVSDAHAPMVVLTDLGAGGTHAPTASVS